MWRWRVKRRGVVAAAAEPDIREERKAVFGRSVGRVGGLGESLNGW